MEREAAQQANSLFAKSHIQRPVVGGAVLVNTRWDRKKPIWRLKGERSAGPSACPGYVSELIIHPCRPRSFNCFDALGTGSSSRSRALRCSVASLGVAT